MSTEKEIEVRVQGQEEKIYYRKPDPERIKMYYEYTQDHFRKGQDYNLKFERFLRVLEVEENAKGILLKMQGEYIYNTQIDSDGELRPIVDTNHDKEYFDCWICVEVYEGGIFRLLAGKGTEVKEHHTVMRDGVPELKHDTFSVEETEDSIVLRSSKCEAVITKEDFSFDLRTFEGNYIYRQANHDQVLDFTHESFPFGFAENPITGERIAVCSSRMEFDENFFGFGEQYSPVNKKMQEVDVFITDPLSVGSARTYVSLPFYFSTKKYGMYVNTHYRSKFFMGNRSNRSTSCHIYGEDIIDIFYIYGENYKDILRRYTDITGKSPMVPKWSFGLWMSRCSYRTEEEVLSIARQLRERDIPCDVMNIDTDWFEIPWACDWKFGKHNFPNPEEMIQELEEEGIKLCLWQKPYITAEYLTELMKEMMEKGWIPLNRYGEPARSNPVIDLTNPDCYDWYKEQLADLFKKGVKVIKTDMGEGAPLEGNYFKGSAEEVRNIYPYLYSKAAYEAECEAGCEPILWGRSTYAGGQKYPIHWAGDPFTDFDGLRYSIRSGLSMGMSGFTYWSHDIGGFLGRPTEQVYIRWAQAGMFCSHARCHGADNPREPWTFGEKAEEIFRKYDKVRYSLVPYIYSSAYVRGKEGLPVMEHLLLANPTDRNCINIDDQWMFGDAILVAPILSEDDTREVYFPEGRWYHYFSHKIEAGSSFKTVTMPLEDMPLYVKEGSILPLSGAARDHIAGKKEDDLSLDIYDKKDGQTEFLYYDGAEHKITAKFSSDFVNVDLGDISQEVKVRLISEEGIQIIEQVKKKCEFKK
ncbi:MAG: hypothetical protein KH828_12225 [Clostridiales bacterium]|nr:hypothetical protein [Clostridiales bacterium]